MQTPEPSIEPAGDKPVRLQCDTCAFVFPSEASEQLEAGDDCPLMVADGIYCGGSLEIYEDEPWQDREE